ncbi:hypothetical protein B9Z55_008137 [Caenorhabditis nigoni]|uniref:Protein kinase domain-containing protein n=1 Tax=Caenorhabditis nigoni TaxID=1611254 RepID=A0A2G5VCV9_9PELO|nr:hypothetical protein B9Z55_008137 [Caenorhabditis nigoni]
MSWISAMITSLTDPINSIFLSKVVYVARHMFQTNPDSRYTIDDIEKGERVEKEKNQKELWAQILDMKNNVRVITSSPTETSILKNLPEYQHVRKIGSGYFGNVHLMKSIEHPEKMVALKIISLEKSVTIIENEYCINRKLMSNEFIIKVFGMSNHSGNCYLTLEYADGGDLFDMTCGQKPMPSELGHHFFKQLLAGVKYMHSQGVVHRDLKPENLLVFKESATLKIADFGYAKYFLHEGNEVWFDEKQYGTKKYMAPEAYTELRYRGPPTDVFACGLVLVAILTSNLLWESAEKLDADYHSWLSGNSPDIEHWSSLDPGVVYLIRQMLQDNPDFRYKIDDIEKSDWMHMKRDQKKLWSQILDMKNKVTFTSSPTEVSIQKAKRKKMVNNSCVF